MTELPPIIERLDAELRDVEREFDGGTDEQIAPVWMRYGPELCAELLRLQAERDYWQGLVVYADENGAFPHGEILQLTAQKDALLEALKEAQEWLWDRDKNAHAVGNAESMIAAAIASVEGKDE